MSEAQQLLDEIRGLVLKKQQANCTHVWTTDDNDGYERCMLCCAKQKLADQVMWVGVSKNPVQNQKAYNCRCNFGPLNVGVNEWSVSKDIKKVVVLVSIINVNVLSLPPATLGQVVPAEKFGGHLQRLLDNGTIRMLDESEFGQTNIDLAELAKTCKHKPEDRRETATGHRCSRCGTNGHGNVI